MVQPSGTAQIGAQTCHNELRLQELGTCSARGADPRGPGGGRTPRGRGEGLLLFLHQLYPGCSSPMDDGCAWSPAGMWNREGTAVAVKREVRLERACDGQGSERSTPSIPAASAWGASAVFVPVSGRQPRGLSGWLVGPGLEPTPLPPEVARSSPRLRGSAAGGSPTHVSGPSRGTVRLTHSLLTLGLETAWAGSKGPECQSKPPLGDGAPGGCPQEGRAGARKEHGGAGRQISVWGPPLFHLPALMQPSREKTECL